MRYTAHSSSPDSQKSPRARALDGPGRGHRRARFFICIAWVLCAAVGSACGVEEDPETDPSARLIPPGDSDFAALEMPEAAGECAGPTDCQPTCEHSCAPPPDGPFTCPIVPIPTPERVMDAECACLESVCAWYTPR